ncbi:carbohydrate-binding protein [Streptomyces griseochromogenes]|uniref:carbohydrate-binding protein n=1 Tax=Streptomyces griseochromogenes TaxID=68214 RepID=UPI0037AE46C5
MRAGDHLVAETAVPVTGDRHTWTTVSAETAPPAEGHHDLRLTLHGDFRLASFRFTAPDDALAGDGAPAPRSEDDAR